MGHLKIVIDWEKLTKEWEDYWRDSDPSKDLTERFVEFWDARGGVNLYFRSDGSQRKTMRRRKANKDRNQMG